MLWWHYCKYLNLIKGMSVIVHERGRERERAENVQKHLRLEFGNIRRRIEDWWEVILVQLFATVKNIVLCLS